MARKRKNKKQVAETVEVSATTNTQELRYQGRVKLQIMHGSRVISTRNFSNKGLPLIFKYISYVLAGQYYKDMRPTQIKLFNYKVDPNDTSTTPNNFSWDESKLTAVSPYVVYDATPVVTAVKNSEGKVSSYATTFRFKIPYYWLYSKTFNVVGLYSAAQEACAYYLFTNENDSNE